ncbi:FUSC family protein [Pusillimonas sp. TS35]|uniref:FUSC family protein n=1 Tax=Paracandidimonas lactea TaxID=2895524 RepID=UPI00137004C3|nr:FUSC family membrane protein [Paracandidimonas lactea]MYN13595.1 FUSC family protein [Pusillimonas sp. TS35]
MVYRLPELQRFFYSHYFFGGLRQAIGVLLPALVIGAMMQHFLAGVIASIGAACVAVIDQPGGPRRYGRNGMLAALLLGSVSSLVTGLASSHSLVLWFVVPALTFTFSMFTVFGKHGGLLGFACLLIMALTLREPLAPQAVLAHTAYSFLGGLFYLLYSLLIHRLFWHREAQQTLSSALFATADYMRVRSQFYDINEDLETSYRQLVHAQASMTDQHQAARDMVLRELPRGERRADRLRGRLLNVFIDMVALLDTLVATHTDYATLRRSLPESDVLLFARDALRKLARFISVQALNIARNRATPERSSVKAEMRAIEYELENYKRDGMAENSPEIYALLVQILRRLRNASRLVDRMAEHMRGEGSTQLVDARLESSLNRFLQRKKWRLGMLTSNLRMDSPHFRYAVRVSAATLVALTLSAVISTLFAKEGVNQALSGHSYWIILTIFVVMKPGYALTRQRNGWRLTGTLLGCAIALLLFSLTDNPQAYFAIMIVTCVLGYSLIQVNFMLAALFNTIFVLLVFHFISPNSSLVIGERLIDTLLGCAIALLCSYILPWWEYNFMPSLAAALRRANIEFLNAGIEYARLSRDQAVAGQPQPALETAQHDAEMRWRVARKNVHIAFGNFAAAFYRMMDEPVRRQRNVPELNHLLIQNHVLALQITSAIPILASLRTVPPGIQASLDAIAAYLRDENASPPASIETEGELATLAYPLRQMMKAAELIGHEMRGLSGATAEA